MDIVFNSVTSKRVKTYVRLILFLCVCVCVCVCHILQGMIFSNSDIQVAVHRDK